jgi:AcrR family transcriptional regulator
MMPSTLTSGAQRVRRVDSRGAPSAAPRRARLAGVTPARQARSEATFRALIRAGRKALEAKTFDQMAVGEIARAARTSVGAFYGRFANKEAFFSAVQEIIVADIEAELEARLGERAVAEASDADFLAAVARLTMGVFRRHHDLYIASFKHSSTRPDA